MGRISIHVTSVGLFGLVLYDNVPLGVSSLGIGRLFSMTVLCCNVWMGTQGLSSKDSC